MNRNLCAVALAAACLGARARAHANDNREGPRPAAERCAHPRDATAVIACALAASPEVAEARAQVGAAAGRRQSAEVLLPSNPTVAGSVSNRRRQEAPASVLNWTVSLSQELELAGQRGARIAQADAERDARTAWVRVVEQEVAAGTLAAYHEAIAAHEAVTFATDLSSTARSLAEYAEARAAEALVPGIEADVARAEAVRIGMVRFEAERRLAGAVAVLALLLDVPAARLTLPTALPAATPVSLDEAALGEQALRLRGEVAAAEAERRVLERRLAVVRRERVPNPSVSLFAERGEVADRIFGIGLSIPVPLPAPLGRTRAGEITEILAQVRAAESSRELVRRRVLGDVARAAAAYRAKVGSAELFAADLVARARVDLSALREALATRRLTLREGLQWQRSLIELLSAHIEARLGRLMAEVELRRVTGLPFVANGPESGGTP